MRPKFYRLRWPRWHDAPNRGAHATSGARPALARRMRRHLTPAGRLRILQMAIPAGLLLFDQSVTGVTDSPPSACTTNPLTLGWEVEMSERRITQLFGPIPGAIVSCTMVLIDRGMLEMEHPGGQRL